MSIQFRDCVRISVSNGTPGTQDQATGTWVPGFLPETVLYDGAADVQEVGLTIGRDSNGMPVFAGDAKAFLRDEAAIPYLRAGDGVQVTFRDGNVRTATIARVRRIDGLVALKWIH